MTSSPPTLAESWAEHAARCVTLATTPWDSLPAVAYHAWCVNATEALRTAAELLDAGVDQLAELTGDTAVEPEPVTYQPNPRLREWRTSTGTVWVLDDAMPAMGTDPETLAATLANLTKAAQRGGATTALVFRDEVDLEQPEDHGLLPDPVDRHLAEAAAALAEDSALDGLAATVQDDRLALAKLRTGIRLELERAGLPTGGDDVDLLGEVAMLAQVVAAARVRPVSLARATLCGGPTDAGEGLVAVDLAGQDRLAAEDSTELFTEPPGMAPCVAPSATSYTPAEQDGAAA